jgi:squalene-hopene/tetraprenyl-beta-curcumene cyclase
MSAVMVARNLRKMRDSLYPDITRRFLAVVQKRPETLGIQPVPEGVERPTEIPFDGGFYFSPVVLQANKGRLEKDGNYWRSYATATCDGILALLAASVPKDDERVTAAVKWLREHTNLDYPQGIPTDYPEPWGDALQYYHFAVRAEVYAALDFSDEEKLALAEKVTALQRADGSFVNTKSPLMKEDEPLLATALAVIALSRCAQ